MSTSHLDPIDAPTRLPGGSLSRQLAIAFALMTLVAVVMLGVLLLQLSRVAGLVETMRHDETSIRSGTLLVGAVREQYVHIAHSLLDTEHDHTGHYAGHVDQVKAQIEALRSRVPKAQAWRLDEVDRTTRELDALFRDQLLPAQQRHDQAAVQRLHLEAIALSEAQFVHADALARAVEGMMAGAHVSASGVTRFGFLIAGVFVGLILLLSVTFVRRWRRSVLEPLRRLTAAARSVGAGDLSVRLGAIGGGELQEVALAFDQMGSQLVEREQALLQAERMAAIGQLAAGVAHELNNPIGIIRGYLKTMSPDADPDVLREELEILDEEAVACQRLVEDLLAYARTPSLELQPVRMHEFLQDTATRLRESDELSTTRLEVRAAPGTIRADRSRLRQVVANLVVNAAQVSANDSTVVIEGLAQAGGRYEFAVLDEGPGLPPAEHARVFEPFYSQRRGGSGLGLAVCQGIVAAHGGEIDVATRAGGGARFAVRLPNEPPERRQRAL